MNSYNINYRKITCYNYIYRFFYNRTILLEHIIGNSITGKCHYYVQIIVNKINDNL